MGKPSYKRILLKLSGEVLMGEQSFGIDPETVARMAAEVKTASLSRVAVWRVPYAQFAQPPGGREHRPTIACGIPGLWRASEVLHSSSLEGAARGGQDAARAVLQPH